MKPRAVFLQSFTVTLMGRMRHGLLREHVRACVYGKLIHTFGQVLEFSSERILRRSFMTEIIALLVFNSGTDSVRESNTSNAIICVINLLLSFRQQE